MNKLEKHLTEYKYIFLILSLILLLILVLKYQGHIWICDCGYIKFWSGAINSNQDSQHIADWYTFSHIIHGYVFYWLLKKFTKNKYPVINYFLMAVALEVGWEILENSPIIINRYRETASLMYFGDSVVNSVSDALSMILGFLLASRSKVYLSVVIVIGLELFTLYYIKDNLTLNIVMLLHPFEFIKNWQLGI